VTVHAGELAGESEIAFRLFTCSATARIQERPEKMIMRDGELTVTIEPRQLITLRSDGPITVGNARRNVRAAGAVRLGADAVATTVFSQSSVLTRRLLPSEPGRYSVYDSKGRLVRGIEAEGKAGTAERLARHTKDNRGRELRSGVYLLLAE
jgi:hypothetical protein